MQTRINGYRRIYKDKWLANEEHDLKDAFDKHDTAIMFRIIKKCIPVNSSTNSNATRLKDRNGDVVATYTDSRTIVQEYFCSVFDGEVVPLASVINTNRSAKIFDIKRGKTLPYFEPLIVPSFHELGCKCSHRRPFLATGEDLISSEAIKRFPLIFSAIYHPIAVKSVCLIESPTQFKGGMIVDLYKNKGSKAEIENYRDIMLASEPGKAIASVLRKDLNKVADNYTSGTQFGSGLNHGSTEFAHLHVKAAIDFANHTNLSSAIIFLDVKTAFASMLRHFILPSDCPDPEPVFLRRLVSLGFSEEEANGIYQQAARSMHWYTAGGSDHLNRVLKDLYQYTWATTEGLLNVYTTPSGSVAGTPLGDLVFTFTITRIFRFIRARLAGAGLLVYLDVGKIEEIFGLVPGVDCDPAIPGLNETSFVDDGAQPLVAPAPEIVANTTKAMSIIDSEFTRFGLILNYTKGKTELLIVFKGKEVL